MTMDREPKARDLEKQRLAEKEKHPVFGTPKVEKELGDGVLNSHRGRCCLSCRHGDFSAMYYKTKSGRMKREEKRHPSMGLCRAWPRPERVGMGSICSAFDFNPYMLDRVLAATEGSIQPGCITGSDALDKSLMDYFFYEIRTSEGWEFRFRMAEYIGNGWIHIRPENLCDEHGNDDDSGFKRGVNIQISNIIWAADCRQGS